MRLRLRRARPLLGLLSAATTALVIAGCTVSATATPWYSENFPDPSVTLFGTSYYAFATQAGDGSSSNIQRIVSPAAGGAWSAVQEALPHLPAWASIKATWAPSVIKLGSHWRMYYTVHDTAKNMQCISVASASSPAATFTDTSTYPFLCQFSRGGSIDPAPFVDPATGKLYLYWKANDSVSGRTVATIWAQQLTSSGLGRIGSPVRMLAANQAWEGGVVEGPTMVAANGHYYLFYSANQWATAAYAIGYAVCSHPLSGCVKGTGPWYTSSGTQNGPNGPGGQSFYTDPAGLPHIAYHAWGTAVGYQNGGSRMLWNAPLMFNGTTPVPPTP